MGLFLSRVREGTSRFSNLPIFSPVEPFWTKNKILNFFVFRAEIFRIFAPLIENS